MNSLRIKAHAKINLVLSVGDRRPDGYHNIYTIFQAVALHDTIEITKEATGSTRVICTIEELSGEANLADKALRLLREWVEVPPIRVFIDKRIPIQAGLGGGSSDAAAVLFAVNVMLDRPVRTKDLFVIASACGSDVPFFLARHATSVGIGRGDELSPLEPIPPIPLIIAKPHVGCDTASMYAALSIRSGAKPPAKESFNDFDSVAPSESAHLISRLGGHLCGSGSAVWAKATDMLHAESTVMQLIQEGYWAVSTQTIETIEGPEWIA
ncbi:MAG: 4-(cytidine 5'-diphospho)-2-C-methyl-D-erythritol kinase [Fimbriimonadales bacterium]|nr:4-(cytidine 5'-diphospho)-2-C-methyl-D-erythritol kinase [Fimbriimonadales bacterium]